MLLALLTSAVAGSASSDTLGGFTIGSPLPKGKNLEQTVITLAGHEFGLAPQMCRAVVWNAKATAAWYTGSDFGTFMPGLQHATSTTDAVDRNIQVAGALFEALKAAGWTEPGKSVVTEVGGLPQTSHYLFRDGLMRVMVEGAMMLDKGSMVSVSLETSNPNPCTEGL